MTDINPSFTAYHQSLRTPGASLESIAGFFTGKRKHQEIVRATQTSLELWFFNKTTLTLERISAQESFANLASISKLVIENEAKNYVVLTSDSGSLSLVEFDPNLNKFVSVSNDIIYKTGLRRLSPCSYSCVDFKGRAVLVSALEKNKVVVKVTKEHDEVIVASPIEANRENVLTYTIKALDVGYENPIFAAIETEYNVDKKFLNYYEYDLGLNTVILIDTKTIQESSNHIVSISGGIHGPSGVLICSEGMIQYHCPFKPVHSLPLPVRNGNGGIKSIIVASVVHQMKNGFFILIQNQFGDVFKITVDYEYSQESIDPMQENKGPGMVRCIKLRYFDTIPLCTSISVLKSGYLYADCENGDQYMYQFEKLGDAEGEKEWNSEEFPDEQSVFEESLDSCLFDVKKLENLKLVSTIESLNPVIGMGLSRADFLTSLRELYCISGTNSRSSLKILHKNIPLSEIVTQDLPSNILNAFCCKIHKTDQYDKFIILSFFDGSIILQIGEEVEEAENSGFLDTVTTLNVHQIGDHSIVQIHATGMKQIFYNDDDTVSKSTDWNPPPGVEVLSSACTNSQVAISLSNGDIVYFELSNGALVEYSIHKTFNSSISSVCFTSIPKNRLLASFMIVTCKDASIHVISTDPKNTLKTFYTIKLPTTASSVQTTTENDKVLVHIGLTNGVYVRYALREDGKLDDMLKKFIISSPLQISLVSVNNDKQVTTMAVIKSLTSYIVVPGLEDIKLVPLPIPEKFIEPEEDDEEEEEQEEVTYMKSYGCIVPIHSQDVPQGLILTHGEKLTIASLSIFNGIEKEDNLTDFIARMLNLDNVESIPLRYTPRDLCTDLESETGMSYVVCGDINISSPFQKENEGEIVTYESEPVDELIQRAGYMYSEGKYGSCINVYSTDKCAIGQTIEILENEMAIKIGYSKMEDGDNYVFVSTIAHFQPLSPHKKCFIRVYHVEEDGSLAFLHKTEFTQPVLSIRAFQNHVLLASGSELGLYTLGKLHVLRKCGIKLSQFEVTQVVDVQTHGKRVFISDARNSVQIVEYDPQKKLFTPMFSDYLPRHVTRSLVLDHDTIIVGDKFGTLSILRIPTEGEKLELLMSFYVGDVITGLLRGKLDAGGDECIVWCGINGSIGTFTALKTVKQVNFFRELENSLRKAMVERNDEVTFIDRDVFKFRSYYVPKKGCVDGSFVESIFNLKDETKKQIAELLEMEVTDVEKRVKCIKE